MASDVARRANNSAPIRLSTSVSWQPGCGYVSQPTVYFSQAADVTDADVASAHGVGRNRFYYTTGDPDPADPGAG